MSDQNTIIDVRLKDDYEAEHLPGAHSCCVFEVGFIAEIEDLFPDQATPILVYGASSESAESSVALEKLKRAGYTNTSAIPGGLAAWKEAEKETVQGDPIPTSPSPDGTFEIDTTESNVGWTGRNLINSHHGTLGIKSGELTLENGAFKSGKIILDMNAISCSDLAGSEMHDVLIAHLKNDDFFDTERFQEAEVDIHSATAKGTPGSENLSLKADLTLCGQTHPITFEATAGVTPEGKPAAQASFSFDRTRWGIIYGSGNFFKRLAGHLVNDNIELQIKILTK